MSDGSLQMPGNDDHDRDWRERFDIAAIAIALTILALVVGVWLGAIIRGMN